MLSAISVVSSAYLKLLIFLPAILIPACASSSLKEESEKAGLKLHIQETKIMASGPITSWQIDGETVTEFIFMGSKSLWMVTTAIKLKDTYSLEEKL